MPNPDGTPDSIAEALARPSALTGGPVDADQTITHRDVGLPTHYEGLLPGQRPYPWKCPHCGEDHVGRVEDGCRRCGVGKDGKEGKPLPPVDPICRACRGNKTVAVKCRQCNGTGDGANVDMPCIDCGGAGTLTIDCRRCTGTGFDPEPQQLTNTPRAQQVQQQGPLLGNAGLEGMAKIMSETTRPAARLTPQLPSIEDDPPPAMTLATPRYFIFAIWPSGEPVMVEIAESPKVRHIISSAKER